MPLIDQILDMSRQKHIAELSPWFTTELKEQISDGLFGDDSVLGQYLDHIVNKLIAYRTNGGVSTVVLGMSGGVDSALTASIFKRAGWRVVGYALPIHQNPEETLRGIEACEALEIEHHTFDLSQMYNFRVSHMASRDSDLMLYPDRKDVKIRLGNLRARERMIFLYHEASRLGGIVASTDNFSELAAGFWTLNGDVGDVSPIQGMNKSWEIPMLSRLIGVPEKTWRALPTDGLGISDGDEAQLGCTYLEWDIMINHLVREFIKPASPVDYFKGDERAIHVHEKVTSRLKRTWFKRMNPFIFEHPELENVERLRQYEATYTVPV